MIIRNFEDALNSLLVGIGTIPIRFLCLLLALLALSQVSC